MNTYKKLALAAGLAAAGVLGTPSIALAQSTDGFHTIQVFPVVVDNTSFAQRFNFRNPNGSTITISPTYFPGAGAQTLALGCPSFTIAANADRTFTSLRALCPALAAGSNFGYLYTYETNTTNMPYSGFSRVSNPQGNGFTVEAFAANEFTSATSTVAGIRRQAATASNPTFQTNCFIGVMNDYSAPATATVPLQVTVSDGVTGAAIGTPATVFNVVPGTLTRLLDVFAAVGAPAGDYLDARFTVFENLGAGEPGVMSFCTVQDNTSFGADFRIGKQEVNGGGESAAVRGAQSDYDARLVSEDTDILLPDTISTASARTFEIGTGSSHNDHVIYLHHPDWVSCEVINPSTGVRALPAYGLEMRLTTSDGLTEVAGGTDVEGFGETYLGDKIDRNTGANARYLIQVENNGFNTGAVRPYSLHCETGSGSTMGEIVRYKAVIDVF